MNLSILPGNLIQAAVVLLGGGSFVRSLKTAGNLIPHSKQGQASSIATSTPISAWTPNNQPHLL